MNRHGHHRIGCLSFTTPGKCDCGFKPKRQDLLGCKWETTVAWCSHCAEWSSFYSDAERDWTCLSCAHELAPHFIPKRWRRKMFPVFGPWRQTRGIFRFLMSFFR